MPKSRTSAQPVMDSAAIAVTERAAVSSKGSISLRIDAASRQLIDEAAALVGKSRTEFMIDSARQQATDVLLDQRLFTLSAEHYEAFTKILDNPPPAGPKLRSLMRRTPAWKR